MAAKRERRKIHVHKNTFNAIITKIPPFRDILTLMVKYHGNGGTFMKVKKMKKLLLITLSCVFVSAPVSAEAALESQINIENENNYEQLKISETRVYGGYPTGHYKKITLLPSVSKVEKFCFEDNLDIEEVEWMASVETVPAFAFSTCPKLKDVTLSDNVKKIGQSAFIYCGNLTSVKLSKNLQSIDSFAFYDCRKLKTLYIPETVTEIGAEAFLNCDSLTVYGKKNSYAYYYCKMNGIPFVSEGTVLKPETDRPYIKSVDSDIVNKQIYATIVLNGKVKNADGYQYQIYDGVKVLANKYSKATTCTLKKVSTVGFARVRSYTVQNGIKIYSKWSNEMRMPPIKLNKDNIKLIKVTGGKKKVTAQFDKLKYSDGFDCVLKNADSGENIVLKNQKKNTVTFRNVKSGTYYLKVHAYTLLNGIKQFGIWSDTEKVIVK